MDDACLSWNRSSAKEASAEVTCFQLLAALPNLNCLSRSHLLQLSPLSSNFWKALAEVIQLFPKMRLGRNIG